MIWLSWWLRFNTSGKISYLSSQNRKYLNLRRQEIDTTGAYDWEHFTIKDTHFLYIASYYDDSTHQVQSVIYQYRHHSVPMWDDIGDWYKKCSWFSIDKCTTLPLPIIVTVRDTSNTITDSSIQHRNNTI